MKNEPKDEGSKSRRRRKSAEGERREIVLKGLGVSAGIAIGQAHVVEIGAVTGACEARYEASPMPSAIPIAAPSVLSVEASTRNCAMMSRRRAPSDFRIPISRVRSATATSMMFMITIAPTTSPIAGRKIPASTR